MKIAICTPVHREVKAQFYFSAMAMLSFTLGKGKATIKPFMSCSSDIAGNRNTLARNALSAGADYILWIDSDHEFPRDSLVRLLAWGRDIVGINQPRRKYPIIPTASVDGALIETTAELVRTAPLQKVDHTGLALCLMRRSVFETVPEPWFQAPHEDVFFFRRAAEHGLETWVDHALSMEVGHIGEHVYRFGEGISADTILPSARSQ